MTDQAIISGSPERIPPEALATYLLRLEQGAAECSVTFRQCQGFPEPAFELLVRILDQLIPLHPLRAEQHLAALTLPPAYRQVVAELLAQSRLVAKLAGG